MTKITKDNLKFKAGDEVPELFPENKNAFKPDTKQERDRYTDLASIPEELPTAGLLPYPIDETDLIGEFESKKNLYLTFAHYINKLTDRIKEFEIRIRELENA